MIASSDKSNDKAFLRNKCLIQLKTILKAGKCLKKWSKQMKNSRQRVNILKEWVSTQQSYIKDLKTIQSNIQKPLKDLNLITSQQQRVLFPNLKAMIQLSQNLNLCIKAALLGWSPHKTMIGQNLTTYSKFFMIYRQYCNNFMKGQQIIKSLKSLPEVLKIEEKLRLDFESFLIKPVQRPPKYQLLLREYQKALSKSNIDYKFIEQAIGKYHQVNQLNNQSMDKQIRVQKMIKLQRLYGGIISNQSGREYFRQFICKFQENNCQLHVFNDMVIVLQIINQETAPLLLRRLMLNFTSFVHSKYHLKYFKNIIFLCGINESIHLQFINNAEASHFLQFIEQIISKLKQKEEDKRYRFSEQETKKKNIFKFKVAKWNEDLYYKLIYTPKFQISVQHTLKPLKQPFFFIKFKIISPFKLNQVLLITSQQIQQIKKIVINKYPAIRFPKLNQQSDNISFYQTLKNRTKIIEINSFHYEEFLNFLFRNQQFYMIWKSIASKLGINSQFFNYCSMQNFNCKCNICFETKENESIQYYMKKLADLKQNKKVIKSRLTWIKDAFNKNRESHLSQDSKEFLIYKQICSFHYFQIMRNINQCKISQDIDFKSKILYLQAKLGTIDYSLLQPQKQFSKNTQSNLRVHLLSAQLEFVQMTLKQDKYVREIIQEIGAKNSLDNVFDWGLFLIINQQSIYIEQSEKILHFLQKWKVQLTKEEIVDEQSLFLIQKLNGSSKWSEDMFGNSKGIILLKKRFYYQAHLQMQWCSKNKQRYNFVIGELYGRLRTNDILLEYSQIIDLCCYYLLRKDFQKIKYYTQQNFETQKLKGILPKYHWPYVNQINFRRQLFTKITNHHREISQLTNQRNAIELIYSKTLQILQINQEWITRNYYLTQYHNPQKNNVIIRVNIYKITVLRQHSLQKILQIDLKTINYRVTTFSLFIKQNNQEYRFDGVQVLQIKKLIQIYSVYLEITQNMFE